MALRPEPRRRAEANGHLEPGDRCRVKLAAPPAPASASSRTPARTRRISAAPASTSASAGSPARRACVLRAAAPPRLVAPGAAREGVLRRGAPAGVPHGRPDRRARRDRRRSRQAHRRDDRPCRDRRRRRLPRQPRHARHWHPSAAGGRRSRALAARGRRASGTSSSEIRHDVLRAPFAPAVVIASPRPALTNYLQERGARFPGFKVAAAATRSYPLGAFGGSFLGLLGLISQRELERGATRRAQAGPDRRPERRRGRVRLDPQRGLPQGADPRRLARAERRPAQSSPRRSSRRRCSSRSTRASSAPPRTRSTTGWPLAQAAGYSPTGGSAVAIDPWTGAIKAIASYPTFNQELAATSSHYLRASTADERERRRSTARSPGSYPTGSTFKPIIAEAALSAAGSSRRTRRCSAPARSCSATTRSSTSRRARTRR